MFPYMRRHWRKKRDSYESWRERKALLKEIKQVQLKDNWRFGKLVVRDYGRAAVLMSLSTGHVQLRDLDERFWTFQPRSIAPPPHIKYVCT
jgi:hypothetical protein